MIEESTPLGAQPSARAVKVKVDRERLRFLLGVIVLPWALLCYGLVTQRLPLGIEGQWKWDYQLERPPLFTLAFPAFAAPVILFVALYAAERFDLRRFGRAATLSCLLALAISSYLFRFFVQWVTIPQTGGPSFAAAIVVSDNSTSHFTVVRSLTSMRDSLADYHHQMSHFPRHAQTHPPGTTMLYWTAHHAVVDHPWLQKLIGRVFYGEDYERTLARQLPQIERMAHAMGLTPAECLSATFIGHLLPLLGALSVIPLFYFARRLVGEAWAWRTAVLSTVVPSFAAFFASIDQVYVLVGLSFLAVFAAAIHCAESGTRRGKALGALAGIVFGVCLFMTLSLLPLALIAVIIFAKSAWSEPERRRELRDVALAGVAGFVGFYALLFVLFRFNMPATVRASLAAHRAVTLSEMPRSYRAWLLWDLLDYFFFLGIPAAGLFASQLKACARERSVPAGAAIQREQGWLTATLVSFVATMLVLDVSGIVRGEVARVWMFLMPLPLIFASARMRKLDDDEWSHVVWIIVFCLMAVQTMLMQQNVGTGFMRPW